MASALNDTALNQNNYAKGFTHAPPCLPVIDLLELDGPQHDQVIETIVKAAENIGFFQVTNHGVPFEVLEELKDSIHKFFNQSKEEKWLYIPKEGSPTPPLASYTDHSTAPSSALVDNLALFYTKDQDALKYWPDCCKEAALKYLKLSAKLAERILGVLMSYLGVNLDESMIDLYMGDTTVGMNYYSAFPSENCEAPVVHKHTDCSTLTILLQDHVGGLFGELSQNGDMANNYKGECVEIKPIAGALIIIVGDALQVLSNGRYSAAEHYVQRINKGTRVSCPIFFNPRLTTMMGPLTQAVEKDGGKPLYREVSYQEFRENTMNRYHSESLGRKPIHDLEIVMNKYNSKSPIKAIHNLEISAKE